MKTYITFLLTLIAFNSLGQTFNKLYEYVDSIGKHSLKFERNRLLKVDSIYSGNLKGKEVTIRDNDNAPDFPLILINNKPFVIEQLQGSPTKGLKSINVMKPEQAMALYGSAGMLGALVLEVDKKLYSRLNRKH